MPEQVLVWLASTWKWGTPQEGWCRGVSTSGGGETGEEHTSRSRVRRGGCGRFRVGERAVGGESDVGGWREKVDLGKVRWVGACAEACGWECARAVEASGMCRGR
jgi:hypothetical protein